MLGSGLGQAFSPVEATEWFNVGFSKCVYTSESSTDDTCFYMPDLHETHTSVVDSCTVEVEHLALQTRDNLHTS